MSVATIAADPSPVTRPTARRLGLLGVIALAQLIVALDYNIVYVALPRIGDSLGFAPHTLQWVVSAYAVSLGGLLLLGGRVADLFGRRLVLVVGLACYAVASAAAGMASTPALLIAGRVGQGVGGALLFPATLALINASFVGRRDRQLAFSVWGAAGAAGMVIGSLGGGVLTGAMGWSSVFFVNVPLAAVGIVAVVRFVDRGARPKPRPRFDTFGALTGSAAVTLFVFALVQGPAGGWSAVDHLTVLAAGALGVGFVGVERRSPAPLLPLRLLRHENLRIGMVVTFLFMATLGTSLYFFTVYFQGVHHYTPLRAGWAFVLPTVATCAGSALAGAASHRFGIRVTLAGGLAVGAGGTAIAALAVSSDAGYGDVVPGLLLYGFGQGIAYTSMFALASKDIPDDDQGVASGLASTTQQVGGAVGLAVLVAVTGAGELVTDPTAAVRTGLYLVALGALVTAGVALPRPRRSRRTTRHGGTR